MPTIRGVDIEPFDIANFPPEQSDQLLGKLFEKMAGVDEALGVQSAFSRKLMDVLDRPDLIFAAWDAFQSTEKAGIILVPKEEGEISMDPQAYPCKKNPAQVVDELLTRSMEKSVEQDPEMAIVWKNHESLGFPDLSDALRLNPDQLKALRLFLDIVASNEQSFSLEGAQAQQDYYNSAPNMSKVFDSTHLPPYAKKSWPRRQIDKRLHPEAQSHMKWLLRLKTDKFFRKHYRIRRLVERLGAIKDMLTPKWPGHNYSLLEKYFSMESFLSYSEEEFARFAKLCSDAHDGHHREEVTFLILKYGMDFLVKQSDEKMAVLMDEVSYPRDDDGPHIPPLIYGNVLPKEVRARFVPKGIEGERVPSPQELRLAHYIDPDKFPENDDLARFAILNKWDFERWAEALGDSIFKLDEDQLREIADYKRFQKSPVPDIDQHNAESDPTHLVEIVGKERFLGFSAANIGRFLAISHHLYEFSGDAIADNLFALDGGDFYRLQCLSFNIEKSKNQHYGRVPFEKTKELMEKWGWKTIWELPSISHIDGIFKAPEIAEEIGIANYAEIPEVVLMVADRHYHAPRFKEFEDGNLNHGAHLIDNLIYMPYAKYTQQNPQNDWMDDHHGRDRDWFYHQLLEFIKAERDRTGRNPPVDSYLFDLNVDQFIEDLQQRFSNFKDLAIVVKYIRALGELSPGHLAEVAIAVESSFFLHQFEREQIRLKALEILSSEQKSAIGDDILGKMAPVQIRACEEWPAEVLAKCRKELPNLSPDKIKKDLDVRAGVIKL